MKMKNRANCFHPFLSLFFRASSISFSGCKSLGKSRAMMSMVFNYGVLYIKLSSRPWIMI